MSGSAPRDPHNLMQFVSGSMTDSVVTTGGSDRGTFHSRRCEDTKDGGRGGGEFRGGPGGWWCGRTRLLRRLPTGYSSPWGSVALRVWISCPGGVPAAGVTASGHLGGVSQLGWGAELGYGDGPGLGTFARKGGGPESAPLSAWLAALRPQRAPVPRLPPVSIDHLLQVSREHNCPARRANILDGIEVLQH